MENFPVTRTTISHSDCSFTALQFRAHPLGVHCKNSFFNLGPRGLQIGEKQKWARKTSISGPAPNPGSETAPPVLQNGARPAPFQGKVAHNRDFGSETGISVACFCFSRNGARRARDTLQNGETVFTVWGVLKSIVGWAISEACYSALEKNRVCLFVCLSVCLCSRFRPNGLCHNVAL